MIGVQICEKNLAENFKRVHPPFGPQIHFQYFDKSSLSSNDFLQHYYIKKSSKKLGKFCIYMNYESPVWKIVIKFLLKKSFFSIFQGKSCFQWSIFFVWLHKFSTYFSAFFKLYLMHIGRSEIFLRFFQFLTYFSGPKTVQKLEFFKTYQIAKIIIKIAFYALKNPYKRVFAKQKATKHPKPAILFTVVSYIYRKKSSFVSKTNSGISAARSAARIAHQIYEILMRIQEK